MNGSGSTAISFLVRTLIDLYVTAVLIRLLLQWVRADFYNPVCQFLIRITNPLLLPLRRLVPSIGRIDTASLALMLLLEILGVWVVSRMGSMPLDFTGIVSFSFIKLIAMLLTTYFFLIIAEVILSWVGGGVRHPAIPLVYQLTVPVLRPFQKLIPPIAGIDLSPLFALIAIRFLLLLIGW
ncbi:MAG: YggT family protein [Xanthomonadales bacterium]|nr:YggT family protein [Xanthomonadales bacterium]